MTDAIDAGGSDAEPPKKKGLDLSIFLKHVAEVDTPIGKLYLFSIRGLKPPASSRSASAVRMRKLEE